MRDRLYLMLYLITVVGATTIHDIGALAALLAVVSALAGSAWWTVAKRALLAIAVFNTLVTVGYVILSLLQETFSFSYVVRLNLRVFLLTFLTLLLARKINPFRALAFSSTLTYLLVLAYSQLLTFRRAVDDFRLALKSRTVRRVRARDAYQYVAVQCAFLLNKSIASATDVAQAMKSRGYFDD